MYNRCCRFDAESLTKCLKGEAKLFKSLQNPLGRLTNLPAKTVAKVCFHCSTCTRPEGKAFPWIASVLREVNLH